MGSPTHSLRPRCNSIKTRILFESFRFEVHSFFSPHPCAFTLPHRGAKQHDNLDCWPANSGLGVINSSMHGVDAPMTQEENYAFSTILVIAMSTLIDYMLLVRSLRYRNLEMIKHKYGFANDEHNYKDVSVETAQEIYRNNAA